MSLPHSVTAVPDTFWTLDRVRAALGGGPRGTRELSGVSTDTRTLHAGDLFVALAGDRYDAHDYLAAAVAAGAAALVVSRIGAATGAGVPVFEVPDTLVALGALARYRRMAWGAGVGKVVIGVTGTNGKTSTKELLRAALESVFDVHATSGNLNNRVGVPLTLLALPDDADVAIIEMGTSLPGEIALLCTMASPDIAIVTSVSEGHLEGLGDLDGVLREKASIYDGAALGIAPAHQPDVVEAATARARQVITAGLETGDLRPARWGISDDDGSGWLDVDGTTVSVPYRGAHAVRNAMLALAASRACGVPLDVAARGMALASVPAMRLAVEPMGQALLVNDAYNANPGSMRAAIELLSQFGRSRGASRQRVAVLGTMLELGPHTERLHDEIARTALGSSIDVLAGVGEFAAAFERGATGDPRVLTAPDVDDLWPLLRPRLTPDAVILVKASRGMRLERLIPHLTAWARG
jgi:UDP-N-acetylmuramoyl-tripeptide--D-alanyl-D-alanine ligase